MTTEGLKEKINDKITDFLITHNAYYNDAIQDKLKDDIDNLDLKDLIKLKKIYIENLSDEEIKQDEFIKELNFKIKQRRRLKKLYNK